jgi:hypothetical protein
MDVALEHESGVPSLCNRVIVALSTMSLLATSGCARSTPTVGFWFQDDVFALPAHAAEQLGGPLTVTELDSIKQVSREELARAFAGLRIRIGDNPEAFWRIGVAKSLHGRGPLPNAGESLSFGWMGGSGAVSFELISLKAIQYAPAGASRPAIVEAIGRGIGRVAAHELAHEILHAGPVHNSADENSYEYPSPDRAAQYYGELRWTTARPLLEQALR